MLKGKSIVVGVTGGIAVYKVVNIVSSLKKLGATVRVVMTKAATEFVQPLTFRTLSNNPVYVEQFTEPKTWNVEHISLADSADLVLIAPATANIIGKVAHGIADDLLSTTLLAVQSPILIVPAMNMKMYANPIVQSNIAQLKAFGYHFMEPEVGFQACGDFGPGRLPEPEEIVRKVVDLLTQKDLLGKKVVITAGGTREAIDPVRFLGNPATGKTGYALAEVAYRRGAEVLLVSGITELTIRPEIKRVSVISAQEMAEVVFEAAEDADVIIKTAAVADYTPVIYSEQKTKKVSGELVLRFKRTTDILAELGRRKKPGQLLIGFAAETENLIDNAQKKLFEKNLDLVIANDVSKRDAGFAVETNRAVLINKSGIEQLQLMPKHKLAELIIQRISHQLG